MRPALARLSLTAWFPRLVCGETWSNSFPRHGQAFQYIRRTKHCNVVAAPVAVGDVPVTFNTLLTTKHPTKLFLPCQFRTSTGPQRVRICAQQSCCMSCFTRRFPTPVSENWLAFQRRSHTFVLSGTMTRSPSHASHVLLIWAVPSRSRACRRASASLIRGPLLRGVQNVRRWFLDRETDATHQPYRVWRTNVVSIPSDVSTSRRIEPKHKARRCSATT